MSGHYCTYLFAKISQRVLSFSILSEQNCLEDLSRVAHLFCLRSLLPLERYDTSLCICNGVNLVLLEDAEHAVCRYCLHFRGLKTEIGHLRTFQCHPEL